VTSGEIEDAEEMWLLHEQKRCYSDIHIALKENRKHNHQQQLGIAIDQNGLLRCYGRMQNCDLSEAAKQPTLLSKNSRFTEMLIQSFHCGGENCSVSQTLNSIRAKSWIPQGRSAVKKVLGKCSVCKKVAGGPYRIPNMAPLPSAPFRNQHHLPIRVLITSDLYSLKKTVSNRKLGCAYSRVW